MAEEVNKGYPRPNRTHIVVDDWINCCKVCEREFVSKRENARTCSKFMCLDADTRARQKTAQDC